MTTVTVKTLRRKLDKGETNESDDGIKVGSKAIVPALKTVRLEEPIACAGREFRKRDKCFAEFGSVVEVININGGLVLVRYFVSHKTSELICPNGAVFYLPREEFLSMMPEGGACNKKNFCS